MSTAKGKAIVPHGGDVLTIELPTYAARYLKAMCARERAQLNFMASSGGGYGLAYEAAFDALNQIESVLP